MSAALVAFLAGVTCVIALVVAGEYAYWCLRPSLPRWQLVSLIVWAGTALPSGVYWGLYGSAMSAMGYPQVLSWDGTCSIALRSAAVTYATVRVIRLGEVFSAGTAGKAVSLSVMLGSVMWFGMQLAWDGLTAPGMLRSTINGVGFPGWLLTHEVPYAIGAGILSVAVMSGVMGARLFCRGKRLA